MSNDNGSALQTAMAYYEAWKSRNHADAMNFVSDDVVCETPFGPVSGAEALHKGESEFANILQGATLVSAFGDETSALLMYHTHTDPAPSVLSAKYFLVEDGKITAMKAVFDSSQFNRR